MEKWLKSNYKMKSLGEQTFDFHSHAQYEIYYFHGGDCKYLIHNTIYHLQPGDIIIMDGLTAHRANPSLFKLYERSVVHFSPDWIKPVIESLQMPELLSPFEKMNNCLLRGREESERHSILQSMKELDQLLHDEQSYLGEGIERKQKQEVEAEMKVLLVSMLVQIFKLSKKENQKLLMQKNEKDIHVEKIADYINGRFKEKITLDDLSIALNLSKFYLSRIFKEVTGTTVMDYVMACRLNQVKYELEMNPEKTLMEVAIESGFESPAHFSRFFKRKLGVTPSEYRRKKQRLID
ncbi:AraC family transcriptional regulator [Lederbergia citrea]|uniref:AraC family transcriptional regulator n=1 Tax=Lederbergia citrea TaxID=2833581 RepID=UPI001BC92E71|nr:AraC family transcriptional regulator [Lederbergia citrea]MBS4178988.1 helix-turn-helix transcriptional regulator [Lederbergia citrea]MBS4205668.1 helix-turn-helix transcriptional regulator [Lederbergia citrea]